MSDMNKIDDMETKRKRTDPQTEATKQKIREKMTGRKHSPATLELIRKNSTTPPMVCPHCGKIGAGSSMRRYHMDNCRSRETSTDEVHQHHDL